MVCGRSRRFREVSSGVARKSRVSKQIHLWIDLTFGINATGPASIRERNCPLVVKGDAYRGSKVSTSSPGAARLFSVPHPRRAVSTPEKLEGVSILETYLDGAPTSGKAHTSLRQFSDRDAIESVDACLREGPPATSHSGEMCRPPTKRLRLRRRAGRVSAGAVQRIEDRGRARHQ